MMQRRRLGSGLVAATTIVVATLVGVTPATADSQTTTNAPLTCQTRFGAQAGAYTTTVTDDVDPVIAGAAVSYRFVTPFKQTLPGGLTGTYKGGQLFMHIPAGVNVTAVSTQQPPGGSALTASAAKQGNDIVVTTTGSIPIDGATHPTPHLIVQATTAASAGGTQVKWLIPYRVIANVDVNGLGPVDADCAPNNPNTVIATTTVLTPGNRAPVFTDQSLPVTTNTAKVIRLAASDADGDPITFSVAQPKHGAVTLNGANATYTPASGFLGDDGFDVTASDGRGGTDVGRVTLKVIATAEGDTYPPTIALTRPLRGAVYTPGQVVNAAFTCADGESGMQSCTGSVANGAAINTALGRREFTVTAVDKGGNTTQTKISYRVIARTPVAQAYTAIAGQPNVLPIACNQPVVPFDQRIPAPVAAPTQVPEADTIVFRFSPGSMSVLPSTVATSAKYVMSAPAGGTVTDVRVVPGTGSANAANSSASIVNGKAVLTVPAVDGGLTGTTFIPRQLEVTIRATAVPVNQVTTKFERFQVRLTTGQAGVNLLTTDYDCPNSAQNTILTRTTAVDVTPPNVTVTAPAHGGRYILGESVLGSFACADNHTVASCTGTTANGQPVATGTTGTKQFLVTATDAGGNVGYAQASYKVFTPVSLTGAFTTTEQSQLAVASQFFGFPVERAPRVGVDILHTVLATNFNPPPVTQPPATRPYLITTKYLPNDAALVTFDASRFGLDANEFQWYGGWLMIVIHAFYTA